MKTKVNVLWVISILPLAVLSVLFIFACNLDVGGGNSGGTSSIFTNFFFAPLSAVLVDSSGGKWLGGVGGLSYLDDNGTPMNKADDTWTTLTNAAVRVIATDASGAKWFCTGSGVSYLDDKGTPTNTVDDTWTTFATETFQAMAIDASGGKWFVTSVNPYGSGVRYFDDNGTPTNKADDTWTSFSTSDGLANDSVKAVAIDSAGGKWFATYFYGGVSFLNDNGTPATKADDAWTTFTTVDGLAGDSVTAVAIDASGGKWFGIWNGKISYLDDNGTPAVKADDTWMTYTQATNLTDYEICQITFDTSGNKWFFSNGGGISCLDDNGTPTNKADDTWINYTYLDGLFYDSVIAGAIDPSGGKWFVVSCDDGPPSQKGGVLNCLDDNGTPTNKADDAWTVFPIGDGLATNKVKAVGFDTMGAKWIATYGGGASYFNDNSTPTNKVDDTWTTFTAAHGLVYNGINAVAIDASGGKWFGTGKGVSFLDDAGTPAARTDDTWTSFTTADGLVSNDVRAVAIDGTDGKWFGTYGGVSYLYDGGTPSFKSDDIWQMFTTFMGLVHNRTWAVVIDASGAKWFGTDGGVSYLDDNDSPWYVADDIWASFTSADGLANDKVWAIGIDASGGKWFCTRGGGVSYLDDKGTPTDKADDTWVTFTSNDGLLGDWINTMAIDATGVKWFGLDGGICYLDDNGTPNNKADDTWTTYSSGPYWVHAVAIDASGGKWIGWEGLSYCP